MIFLPDYFLYFLLMILRHLDSDLGTVLKSGEPFDWNRISFILEAHQLMGKLNKTLDKILVGCFLIKTFH